MKRILILLALAVASVARAQAWKVDVAGIDLGPLEGKGQVLNPSMSPNREAVSFEFLGASGDTLAVYLAENTRQGEFPPVLGTPAMVLGQTKDVFSLGGSDDKPVSEQAVWGPSTKRGTQMVMAATRREAARGGNQINFDLIYISKGKRRFITDHPENDSEPAFAPNGEHLAFTSGRTGEGDIYLYSFYQEDMQLIRITFEEGGSELFPTWSPDGKTLAYIAHLGGTDHLMLIDNPLKLTGIKNEAARAAAQRAATRDLTTGFIHSCSLPSFSPDSKTIAFYVHPKGKQKSDLYIVTTEGGEAKLIARNVLAGSRSGPAFSADGKGLFVVEENADLMNPIIYIPLANPERRERIVTGTQLNNDVTVYGKPGDMAILFTAQGAGEKDSQKRWMRLFAGKLTSAE